MNKNGINIRYKCMGASKQVTGSCHLLEIYANNKKINIVVVSGMLPHDKSTILFCGYQGLGSAGRYILDSDFGEEIRIDNKKVKRKCDIDFMNMSSHADYKRIINMIKL